MCTGYVHVELDRPLVSCLGLFARCDLPAGKEEEYHGEYFESKEALEQAGRDKSAYVIGKKDNYTAVVDGAAILHQYAIYANHTPKERANAQLTWDNDRYHGRSSVGQPVPKLIKPVAAGQGITVDYGPWYAYRFHGFVRRALCPDVAPTRSNNNGHPQGTNKRTGTAGSSAVDVCKSQVHRFSKIYFTTPGRREPQLYLHTSTAEEGACIYAPACVLKHCQPA